ncbi:MAG: hypothetical protein WAL97_00070, partial [Halobacteriota archaeon]
QVTTYWYLSPFINNQEIPLKTPPPLSNVPQRLLVNEEIVEDFAALLIRECPLNECFKLPPVVQNSVKKQRRYTQILREPFVLLNLTSIESVNVKANLNVFLISKTSQTGDDCSDVLPDTVEFEFVDSIV